MCGSWCVPTCPGKSTYNATTRVCTCDTGYVANRGKCIAISVTSTPPGNNCDSSCATCLGPASS